MVSGLKGQRQNSSINVEDILRPRAKENVSPENRTENLWAGSRIGRGGGKGGMGDLGGGGGGGDPPPTVVRHPNTSLAGGDALQSKGECPDVVMVPHVHSCAFLPGI